jgi:hypothetical protein
MRRRALFILASMSMMLGVLLLGGVALAKEITGTSGSDDLEGTNWADKIWGLRGSDFGGSEARTISPVSKAVTSSTVTVAKTRFVALMATPT